MRSVSQCTNQLQYNSQLVDSLGCAPLQGHILTCIWIVIYRSPYCIYMYMQMYIISSNGHHLRGVQVRMSQGSVEVQAINQSGVNSLMGGMHACYIVIVYTYTGRAEYRATCTCIYINCLITHIHVTCTISSKTCISPEGIPPVFRNICCHWNFCMFIVLYSASIATPFSFCVLHVLHVRLLHLVCSIVAHMGKFRSYIIPIQGVICIAIGT